MADKTDVIYGKKLIIRCKAWKAPSKFVGYYICNLSELEKHLPVELTPDMNLIVADNLFKKKIAPHNLRLVGWKAQFVVDNVLYKFAVKNG